ncbi:hypothetical protein [Marinobacterium jannaschii]|uniref:hypothetical protein n=1 Tax=Marinobacterium jannaschii TaxID=64970 RepID=UPI000AC0E64E|nr:hypothetical protein [Marinobacterium jannaschii]
MKLFKFLLIAIAALALLTIPAQAATEQSESEVGKLPPAVQSLIQEDDFCRSCR